MRMDGFMEWYKGKTTIMEVMKMPNRIFSTLYNNLYNMSLSDDGKKELENKKSQELLEGMIGSVKHK